MLAICTCFSQSVHTTVTVVGCQDVSDKTCTKKKIHEALLQTFNTLDVEVLMRHSKKDVIFAYVLLAFQQTGKLSPFASYIRFYEDENTPLRFDVFRKIPKLNFAIEKPAKSNTSPKFREVIYFRIDRQKKTLEPLYDYIPDLVPFSKPDSYVLFPGCEGLTQLQEQRRCFNKKMAAHFSKHFTSDLVRDLNLKGAIRIEIHFRVAKNGAIEKVRVVAPNQQIKESFKRILLLTQDLKPTIIDGMPKSTPIMVPFNFIVD